MVGNALLMTTAVFMALGFFLMDQCRFLIPYRQLLWSRYGENIAVFALVLFINLFAAFYAIGRKLFLKDTGRKLAHLGGAEPQATGVNLTYGPIHWQ